MGAAHGKSNSIKIDSPAAQKTESGQSKTGPIPELRIKAESWTRESHGLYDFEGTETETKYYKLKGNVRFSRSESRVTADYVTQDNFEEQESHLLPSERDSVIARFLYRNNSYWMYHKQFIDEGVDQVLERKPEEKIWQVVRSTYQPQVEFPCYRVRRRDLIKVGRVRFKVRDIMSPVYRDIQDQDDFFQEKHQMIYPAFDESSIVDESSMANSHALLSQQEDDEIGAEGLAEEAMSLNEDNGGMDLDSATESDDNEQLAQPIRAGQLRNIQLNQVLPGIDDDLGFDPESSARGSQIPQTGRRLTDPKHIRRRTTMAAGNKKKKVEKKVEVEPLKVSAKSLPEVPVCRICLMEDNEADNPLITPCRCSGSMRFIHHACLKTWFHGKRVMKQGPIVTTYFWKNLECELCKQPYPYETRSLDGKQWLNIIEYETPARRQDGENYYIVLESISSNTSKVIHVINMEKTIKLYIGRGHDAHVRVTDISVSRLHAVLIRSTQGYYFLTDNDSKFGTLALVKTPIEIKPKTQVQLQVGRTLFSIEVRNSLSALVQQCCCFSKQKTPKRDSSQLISLNGVDYFPPEFATKLFCQVMQRRKKQSLKRLNSKIKQQSPLEGTKQDQSDLANVDHFIEQIAQRQNNSVNTTHLRRLSSNIQHVSDPMSVNHGNLSQILSQHQFDQPHIRNQSSRELVGQIQGPNENHSVNSGHADNERLRQSQSESESESEGSQSDDEEERRDQEALELAIEQSLALQADQSRNPRSQTYPLAAPRDVIEEAKEFCPDISADEQEERKVGGIDLKAGPSAQQIQDENSVLSTARVSNNGVVEFRSTVILNKGGEDGDAFVNSARGQEPSSALINKTKPLDLQKQVTLDNASTPKRTKSQISDLAGRTAASRQLINEVIPEVQEHGIDDERYQTIEQELSGQQTEIIAPETLQNAVRSINNSARDAIEEAQADD